MSVIYTSIVRRFGANEWQQMSSEALAAAITAPSALAETRLTSAFQAAVAAGASLEDLGKCYSQMNNEFVVNLRDALHDGDLVQVHVLVAIAAEQLSWSAETVAALNGVIAGRLLRQVDVVARELGEIAPETVDAAEVDAALEAAGFVWDGAEWGRGA